MSRGRRIPIDEALLAIVWIALAAVCVHAYLSDDYLVGRTLFVCRWSGYSALGFLGLSLLVSPLARLLGWLRISIDRAATARISRNAGIASALAAMLHAILVGETYLEENWFAVFSSTYLQAGALALTLLIVLLVGSIKPLMAKAKWQLWKPLFRLSFAAAILVLYHMLYAPFNDRFWTLVLYGTGGALSLIRWVPERTVAKPAAGQVTTQPTSGEAVSGAAN